MILINKKLNRERFIALTFWLFSILIISINFYLGLSKKLWLDEIATLQYTNVENLMQLFTNLYHGADIHPPLYYTIFFFVRNIFPDNILTYRIFSFIICLTSIIALLKIFQKFLMHKDFYLVIGLLAITSFFSQYLMMELRSYGLFFLLFLVFIYYWLNIQIDSRTVKRDLVIISIVSVLLNYTHYFAIPYVISLLLILAVKEKKVISWLPLIIAIITFIPWIKAVSNQINVFNGNYWQPIPSINQLLYLPFFYFGKELIIILVALLIMIFIGLNKKHEIKKMKNSSVLKYFFWVIFLLPLMDFAFSTFDLLVFFEGYFIPTFIGFLIIIGIFLQRTLTTNNMKTIFFVLILVLGASRILKFDNSIQLNNQNLDAYLDYENNGIQIVCESPYLFYPLNYYSKKNSFWFVIDSTSAAVEGNVSNSIFDYYWNRNIKEYYNINNIIEWEKFNRRYHEFFIINESGRLLFEYYIEGNNNFYVESVSKNIYFIEKL